MFKNYTDCLFNDKTILKSEQRFRSDCHNVYTEQINKNALRSNDDKKLKTFDKISTCESQMLSKYKWSVLMIMRMKAKHNII